MERSASTPPKDDMPVLAVQMDFSQTTFKDHLRAHCKLAYQRQKPLQRQFTYSYAGV